MKFEKLNLNPKGVKACDCVIRSIAFATNQSWDTVYLALSGPAGNGFSVA